MKEQWKPIYGYKGFYEISNYGRVRSLERKALGPSGLFTVHGKILKPDTIKHGYKRIQLFKHGKYKRQMVHRLVMRAFVGPVPRGKEVNHKNGITSKNSITNLCYMTRAQNNKHAYEVLGKLPQQGIAHGRHKLTENQVRDIRKMRKNGRAISEIMKKHMCCAGTVSLIANRKIWRHLQ